MALNEKESKVFAYIKEDPFISQQALADKIGLSRPAVANIISGLVKRGYLLGKAYVVNETRPIICIGAAAIDRRYFIENELITGESNKVTSQTSCGGVALSVAENLGRLQEDVVLMSLVGEDEEAKTIKDQMRPFMKLNEVEQINAFPTGTYMEVLDNKAEMVIGLAEMDIYDRMTPNWLMKRSMLLKQAQAIMVDTNTPRETTEMVLEIAAKNKIPVIMVTVSALKAHNIPSNLKGVKMFVTTQAEAEMFFDMKIENDEDLKKVLNRYLDMGTEHVIITYKSKCIQYASHKHGTLRFDLRYTDSDSYVWGTNEALAAGLIYRYMMTKNVIDVLMTGIVNAAQTTHSIHKVRHDLSQATLEKDIKAFGESDFEKI
ncbi:PfkB family carbohydrate kinase [Jeotgalibaca sp. MA1X17-3]|uniref:PfkB family carbohydrate kinase n=1 Tax=Jeotgalibaca sp. MA1X17-3 TaxID=2908211 RepID=UPI001F22E78E|nr:PfkB family carbohydrate kinase [Jeotgalibaca sp. MA1X17-3]UJF16403.1 PfkB family carbohydrate kinase [Jeotgalibaca sp. MA1X17-3]